MSGTCTRSMPFVTETLLMQRTHRRTILVTTADSDNKTSEFALRFASAAARMRRRVLLVDIDFTEHHHPEQTRVYARAQRV